jgi:outer membrane lipoprotein LolB
VRRIASILFAAALAGCAVAPPRPAAPQAAYVGTPFAIDGRLSATRGSDAIAVNFTWTHAPPRDDLSVSTPLGQIVAELRGDASARRVTLVRADGSTEQASDWSSLTTRALGFALPVEGLSAWARGMAHGGSPHTRESDAEGRPSLLRQDGWEIVYGYADAQSREPRRMRLVYPGVEVRIVVDRWR